MLSESLYKRIEEIIETNILATQSVGGGSINRAAKIDTSDKTSFFLKWNDTAPADMFPKEKQGLELLASAETALKLPEVIAVDSDFLLLEFIREGSASANSAEHFGRELAALHHVNADKHGLEYDNYIGRLPQLNTRYEDWVDFFIEERLQPQLIQAVNRGKLHENISGSFQQLYKKLPDMLPDEPASLLHGDLWSGNYFYDQKGRPVIFDPAVCYGNREIEIAFTHLFGGFSAKFYDAYQQAFPLAPDFDGRKDIYNLYPLLVHTNMFGGHYGKQVEQIAERLA